MSDDILDSCDGNLLTITLNRPEHANGLSDAGITQLSAAAAGTVLTGQGTSSDPAFAATPTLGVAGTTKGTLALAGNTSGTVTMQPAADGDEEPGHVNIPAAFGVRSRRTLRTKATIESTR